MLLVNDVYQHENDRFRILWLREDHAYWINIDHARALPVYITFNELMRLLSSGQIIAVDDPYESILLEPVSKASESGQRSQAQAWEMISPYVYQEPDIYIRDKRGPFVQEIMSRFSTTKQTVYAKFRLYWQRGKSPNALYPDTRNMGGVGKPKRSGEKKRGRPRTTSPGTGVNIDDSIAKIFRTFIKSHYLTEDQDSLMSVYERALVAYGVDPETATEEELAEAPTYEQFWHFVDKEVNQIEKARKRVGDIVFNKDLRPVLGTSTSQVFGPGGLYQIDATIGDIYLLSEDDRSKIIGRPVIYIVIDVFSRMITGMYVGLEGPSWVSAMIALGNTMMDKVEFCAKYQIEIEPEQWPVIGKPEAIIGDRGEMLSHSVEVISQAFNIEIQNTPPYRADWKGIVERQFKTIQAKFKPYVEGMVECTITKKRGGRDYRLDAELTLTEFTRVIIECVLEYNNSHLLSSYDRDKGMPAELPLNPLAIWNWGIRHRTGKLRSVNQDLAIVNLLPHKEVAIYSEGIKLFNCYYSSEQAIREGWFHRLDHGTMKKLLVAYDPYNANQIYVRPQGRLDQYMVCTLTERSRAVRDLTFWGVWRLNEISSKTSAKAKLKQRKGRLLRNRNIEQITSDARLKNPDLSHLSHAERTKGIRENRSEELATQRGQHTGLVPSIGRAISPSTEKPSTDPASNPFDIPDMLEHLFGR